MSIIKLPSRKILCMTIQAGLIGLSNADKSTLFNALATPSDVLTKGYSFATIDPLLVITKKQTPLTIKRKDNLVPIVAEVESEAVPPFDKASAAFMESLSIKHQELSAITVQTYEHLNVITFFTCTLNVETTGKIHNNLRRCLMYAAVHNRAR